MPVLIVCKRCSKEFKVRPSHAKRTSFCSRKCANDPIGNFWDNVQKTDGCWLWTGGKDKDGYGKITVNRRHLRSHRFSWELHFGQITNGLYVLHRCDVPACVRPDHLFIGTNQDNVDDMFNKQRENKAKGERHGLSKKTPEEIAEMIALRKQGMKIKEIASRFGISESHTGAIVRGIFWKHLEHPIEDARIGGEPV